MRNIITSILIFYSSICFSLDALPSLDECNYESILSLNLHDARLRNMALVTMLSKEGPELIRFVTEHTSDPVIPIKDQMRSDELEEFNKKNNNFNDKILESTFESIYERDLEVIIRMMKISEQVYKRAEVPEEDTEDGILYQALEWMSSQLGDNITSPASNICDIDLSIALLQMQSFESLENYDLEAISNKLDKLKSKYGISNIEDSFSVMSEQDQNVYLELRPILTSLVSSRKYAMYLESIKQFIKISTLIHDSYKNAINKKILSANSSKEDFDRVVEYEKLSKSGKIAFMAWKVIDEMIPANMIINSQKSKH